MDVDAPWTRHGRAVDATLIKSSMGAAVASPPTVRPLASHLLTLAHTHSCSLLHAHPVEPHHDSLSDESANTGRWTGAIILARLAGTFAFPDLDAGGSPKDLFGELFHLLVEALHDGPMSGKTTSVSSASSSSHASLPFIAPNCKL